MLFIGAVLLAVAALAVWLLNRRKHVLRLDSSHVLITGGSEGLGLAFAKLCARKGAHVTLVARNEAKLVAAQKAVEAERLRSSQQVGYESCDVANAAKVEAAIASSVKQRGPVDVVVANAGMSVPKLFEDLSDGELRQMMEVNYFGAVNVVRAVLPGMKRARQGRVVFVASAMSLTAFAGFSGYCGSKWAVRGLAECLHSEVAPYNISVHINYATTMATPGLTAENAVKPRVTHELESMGSSIEPEQAATLMFDGVDGGSFAITADAGAELMSMGSLLSPHDNLPLRMLIAPLVALLGAAWRWHTRRLARNHAKH